MINSSQIKTKRNQSEDQILPSVVHFPIRVHFELNYPKLKILGTASQPFSIHFELRIRKPKSFECVSLLPYKWQTRTAAKRITRELRVQRAVVVFRLVIIQTRKTAQGLGRGKLYHQTDRNRASREPVSATAGRLGGRLIFLKTIARDTICSAPQE